MGLIQLHTVSIQQANEEGFFCEASELSQLTRHQRSTRKGIREEMKVPRVLQRQEEEVASPRSTHLYESLD